MYQEFNYIILDYFRTLRKKDGVFDIAIPFLISGLSYCVPLLLNKNTSATNVEGSIITLLSVLIGFSLAVFTVFTTTNNPNIEKLKKEHTVFIVDGIKVTLFHNLLTGIVYPFIIEIALLITNLLYIASPCKAESLYLPINIFFISHLLFVTLRSITNLYFVLTAPNKK